ncbi:hypothetical protein [Clostridium mediterraneense]|uniref:hypothetical protein n=1 Tax=Clostridium mediterraneense TaxID=1805472 RepID=UPI001F20D978|nr:hypothetical protein [Clostridium mediterraneense]
MNNYKSNIPYLPQVRSFGKANKSKLLSYNKKTFINIPALGADPIVSNNIATSEFDYTENLVDEDTTH